MSYQVIERSADGTERVRFTCNDRRAVERAVSDYERKRPRGFDGELMSNASEFYIQRERA